MGAWGPGTFEDDLARDWLEDLHDSDPIAFLTHCLDLTDAPQPNQLACIGVVCSAEMIHALTCAPRQGLPPEARRWLADHASLDVSSLIPAALAGLDRVLGPESEMLQMWEDEPQQYPLWQQRMRELVEHLQHSLTR